jgi:hypothetical protein
MNNLKSSYIMEETQAYNEVVDGMDRVELRINKIATSFQKLDSQVKIPNGIDPSTFFIVESGAR